VPNVVLIGNFGLEQKGHGTSLDWTGLDWTGLDCGPAATRKHYRAKLCYVATTPDSTASNSKAAFIKARV